MHREIAKKRQIFFSGWLQFVAFAHILGGIAMSMNFPRLLWQSYREHLQVAIVSSSASNSDDLLALMIQLFGATIASWGALMFYLVRRAASKRDNSTYNALLFAVLLWFGLDTGISLSAGIFLHLYINSVAVLSILIPLLWLKFAQR